MFLKEAKTGDLVEILDFRELSNPFRSEVMVQYQRGEDLCEPEMIAKNQLNFPSGESLPQCWLDSHYRDKEIFSRF